MSSAGFEPAVAAIQRQQTHAVDRAATGSGTQAAMYCRLLLHLLQTDGAAFSNTFF